MKVPPTGENRDAGTGPPHPCHRMLYCEPVVVDQQKQECHRGCPTELIFDILHGNSMCWYHLRRSRQEDLSV